MEPFIIDAEAISAERECCPVTPSILAHALVPPENDIIKPPFSVRSFEISVRSPDLAHFNESPTVKKVIFVALGEIWYVLVGLKVLLSDVKDDFHHSPVWEHVVDS